MMRRVSMSKKIMDWICHTLKEASKDEEYFQEMEN